MTDHEFRAYCDICNEGSEWMDGLGRAHEYRERHFRDEHPDNPMVMENCRIQRRTGGNDE